MYRTEDNVDEKSEMDRSAAGRDGDWPCVTGPVASLACDVRSYQGSFHYRNGDAMGASQSARVSLRRCQERKRRGSELFDRDVQHSEYDQSRLRTDDLQ